MWLGVYFIILSEQSPVIVYSLVYLHQYLFILGDYSPTPSSLIGALAINLGISVRNLSRDKEEDLRRQYFCWWSRPLPEEHSFRRILCFEGGFGSRGSTPPKVVGAVFRCLVPILSGKDSKGGSVIMPLLASGDQVSHWINHQAGTLNCSVCNSSVSQEVPMLLSSTEIYEVSWIHFCLLLNFSVQIITFDCFLNS